MSSFRLRLLSAISAAAAVTCLSSLAHSQGNSANAPGHNKAEVIPAANHDHDFVFGVARMQDGREFAARMHF